MKLGRRLIKYNIVVCLAAIFYFQYSIWQKYFAAGIYQKTKDIGAVSRLLEINKELVDPLELAARLNPLASEYQFTISELFLSLGKYDLALNKITYALLLEPTNVVYHLKLADYYIFMKDMRSADREFLNAIILDPNNFMGHYKLANFYSLDVNRYRPQQAYQEYQKALFLLGDDIRPKIYEEIFSRYKSYDTLKDIIPNTENFRYSFANLLREKGEIDNSLREYKKTIILAHKSDNKNIEANSYHWLGRILFSYKGKVGSALHYIKIATKLDPNNAWFLNNLGEAYLRVNQLEEAKDAFYKAITIESKRSSSLVGLGEVYEKLNLPDEARNFYLDAIKFAAGPYAADLKKQANEGLARLK